MIKGSVGNGVGQEQEVVPLLWWSCFAGHSSLRSLLCASCEMGLAGPPFFAARSDGSDGSPQEET
jgi:hypothetical protein